MSTAAPLLASPPPPRPRRLRWPQSLSAARRAETLTAWGLVLPAGVGFLLFYAWPTLRAIEISFTDWNLLRPPRFVGWDNYARMLHDGRFWHAMQLSGYYVLLN